MPIGTQPFPGMKPGTDQGTPGVTTPPRLNKPKKDTIKLDKPSKKLKDIIDIRPQVMEDDKSKSKSKHSVMAFGRMNPPHSGHQAVVDKVADVAKKVGAKRGRVVVSHSHDKKKNPLDQKSRMDYIKKMNPSNKVRGSSKEHPNFLSYAKKLHKKGTTDLHVVTGSDRAKEFKKTLDKYNNHPDHYSFKSINVHSAGDRDDKAKGVKGASGTKQREYAKKGDYKSFAKNLPKNLQKDGESMYKKMREEWENYDIELALTEEVMDQLIAEDYLQEDYINERVLTLLQRRKAGLKMRRLKFRIARMRKLKRKRMATRDMLVRRARRQARNFIRKRIAGKMGAMYNKLSPSQKIQIDKRVIKKKQFINKMAARLLPRVKQAELKRLRKVRSAKESVNQSFESLLTEIRNGGQTESNVGRELKAFSLNLEYTAGSTPGAPQAKIKRLKDKHKQQDDNLEKRQAIEKSKVKVNIQKAKQAEIRREAVEVAEAVDVMVDALGALDRKAQIAGVELDTLFVEFVEGYKNPHGQQTNQQGGFAAVNRLLAEMSAAEKDKAEDIVKGMKKKASYFTKKYGKDAKSVMYATANKMAQEEVNESLKDWFGKGKKGDWVRVGTDGKIKGQCAREEGEGKPKCMPRSKAHSMSKKDRASAARRKRAADPIADRAGKGGKPIMVSTDKKTVKEAKMSSKESLSKWEHQDSVKVAEMLIKEYGQPDEVTETMLKWNKLGDFGPGEQETYIVDESIPHDFPEPHRDFLYTAKKIKVPTRIGDTLLHVTGSIVVDGLKETVTARCGSLNANALTLGFVEDLAKGKVVNNKAIAKKEYAKRIKEGPLPSWYTDKLKKYMSKEQQEQTHMCGCLMTEEQGITAKEKMMMKGRVPFDPKKGLMIGEQKPSGKASKPYSSHGIPKDATKAELKSIRSNPNSSKGKKQLAHWKLNMHKK